MPTVEWTIRVADIATVVALLLGPAFAVLITFWGQSRRERHAAKMRLFLMLLGERKKIMTTPVADALNTTDVVFADNHEVISLWHKYYMLLHQTPSEERGHTWLEFLQAMAIDLSYPRMTQTTLDKYYIPQGHVDEREMQQNIAKNFLRVLENSERFLMEPKKKDGS